MYLNVRSLVGLEPTPKISLPSVDDVQKFRASPGRKSKQHLSPCHPWFTLGGPQRQMNGPGNRSLLLQNNRSDNYINSLYIVLQAIIASVCKKETCFTSLCTLRWGHIFAQRFFQLYSNPLTFCKLSRSNEANNAGTVLCWPSRRKSSSHFNQKFRVNFGSTITSNRWYWSYLIFV